MISDICLHFLVCVVFFLFRGTRWKHIITITSKITDRPRRCQTTYSKTHKRFKLIVPYISGNTKMWDGCGMGGWINQTEPALIIGIDLSLPRWQDEHLMTFSERRWEGAASRFSKGGDPVTDKAIMAISQWPRIIPLRAMIVTSHSGAPRFCARKDHSG